MRDILVRPASADIGENGEVWEKRLPTTAKKIAEREKRARDKSLPAALNTTPFRSGSITLLGFAFDVDQSAVPCELPTHRQHGQAKPKRKRRQSRSPEKSDSDAEDAVYSSRRSKSSGTTEDKQDVVDSTKRSSSSSAGPSDDRKSVCEFLQPHWSNLTVALE